MNPTHETQLQNLYNSIISGHDQEWIFMIPSSIGEVAIACSLLDSFKMEKGGKVKLVVHRNHLSVLNFFSDSVDSFQSASTILMRKLVSEGLINSNEFSLGKPISLWVNHFHDGNLFELHKLYRTQNGREGLSFIDMYRYMLQLPWDAKVSYGRIKNEAKNQTEKFCMQNGIERNNSIILFPGNNTNLPANAYLWNSICKKYLKKGYKVFQCITGANNLPLGINENIPILDMNPELAIAVCNYAGHLISGSNGLVCLGLFVKNKFKFDVLLTDGINLSNLANQYQECDPMIQSNLNISNGLINGQYYHEWLIRSNYDETRLEDIAEAIVNNYYDFPDSISFKSLDRHLNEHS